MSARSGAGEELKKARLAPGVLSVVLLVAVAGGFPRVPGLDRAEARDSGEDHRIVSLLRHATAFGIPRTFVLGGSPDRSLAAGDFNDDGFPDLVVNGVWLLAGDGAGGFGPATHLGPDAQQQIVAVGDFDGDGIDDRAVADRFTTGVTVLFGDREGRSSTTRDASGHARLTTVLLADFDADGNADVATVDGVANDVTVLLGDEHGAVRATTRIPVGARPSAVAVADFNQDGVPDLVVLNSGSGDISILLGDGTGAFGAATHFPAGARPTGVAVGDFNGDGLADLVVADSHSGHVSILLGNGVGSFGPPIALALQGIASGADSADARQDAGSGSSGASTDATGYEGIVSLTLNPTTISGGSGASSAGTVTLNAPAPAGGVVVTLTSSNVELAASVPEITVPEGASQATFTVGTNRHYRRFSGLGFTVTISAAHGGVTRSATLNVTAQPRPGPISSFSIRNEGQICMGGVEPSVLGNLFDCKPPNNPVGQDGTCTFRQECARGCELRPVENGSKFKDVCATTGPFPVAVNPKLLVGGEPTAGTLQLSAPAPDGAQGGAATRSLLTNVFPVVTFPIPAGATSTGFDVRTARVASPSFAGIEGTIDLSRVNNARSGRVGGTWVALVPGQAPPFGLLALDLEPTTIAGGGVAFASATLNQVAPAPELAVVTATFASSNPAAASIAESVTYTQGSSSAGAAIQTQAVSADTPVTISATVGDTTLTRELLVRASPGATAARSFFLDPLQVEGGNPVTGTVVLNGAAPSGGAVVTLTSGNAVVSPPPSVTVPAGSDRVSFAIATSAVTTDTTVSLSATHGNGSAFTSLMVLARAAPATLASLSLNPTSVVGGNASTGTATLSAAAPSGGATVTLTSSHAAATVPASVTVAAGTTSATFSVSTSAVSANTSATITGSFGGTTRSAALTVTPATAPPATDTISIQQAEYAAGSRELRVQASSTSSTVTLTVHVAATDALIGTLTSKGGGSYEGRFTWPTNPSTIRVKSSGGGSATRTVTLK